VTLLPVTTVIAIKWTNSPEVPFYFGLWLPAAITYGLAVRSPQMAIPLAVVMEIMAATMIPGHVWFTWLPAAVAGPAVIALCIYFWRVDIGAPSRSDWLAIRSAFLVCALVTAAIGVACQVVIDEVLFGQHSSQPVLSIYARWLVSDLIAAQLLGPWLVEAHRRLCV
jgi:hypothetical protein